MTREQMLEAAKKTECGGCAVEWVNVIFDLIGSCETCVHGREVRDRTDFCIKLGVSDNLPGYCGYYERRKNARRREDD